MLEGTSQKAAGGILVTPLDFAKFNPNIVGLKFKTWKKNFKSLSLKQV